MADPRLLLLVATLLVGLPAGLWPVFGFYRRWLRRRGTSQRSLAQDVLNLFRHCESQAHAPVVAAQVPAAPLAEPALPPASSRRLSELPLGGRARVLSIAPACRGLQRRRLLDLGLVPGTVVSAELKGAAGGPTAYRIRGAVIALRRAQADQIQIIDA